MTRFFRGRLRSGAGGQRSEVRGRRSAAPRLTPRLGDGCGRFEVFSVIVNLQNSVEGIAFGRNSTKLANPAAQLARGQVLTRCCAGKSRDVLLHQGPAVIVGSGSEA